MFRPLPLAGLLEQAGPFLLGALAVCGVFARGWANVAYGLLFLWGLGLLAAWALLNRQAPWPDPRFRPPARWVAGLAAFTLAWLVAVLAGGRPTAGLKELATHLYLLALPLLAWAAFSRRPDWPSRLRFLWGLGLIVAAALTFREGGCRLICLRAKAHLGMIELGSILGQLFPVMFAALLQAHAAGRRGETAFFALALAAAGLALTQNCSRQTFLAVPALCLLTLWVYRRHVRWKSRLVMALAVLFLAVIPPLAGGGGGAQRLLGSWEFGDGSAKILDVARRILWSGAPPEVPNATPLSVRLDLWKIGWDAFLDHPVLGQGPGSGLRGEIQSAEPEGGTRIITGRHAHNMFIDVLAHTGLAGFLGFLALHLAPLSLLWPHRRNPDPETFFWVWAALAVNLQLLLNGLTDQGFGLKPMMYIHWTVTAAGLWQTRESRREANNP